MIDTHCHLTDSQFNDDLPEVLARARSAGVKQIINAGYDVATSKRALQMYEEYDWLRPAVGIHPHEASDSTLMAMHEMEECAVREDVVAVGETGLDYYREFAPAQAQRELFRKHIALARKVGLPLLIHTRKSIDDAIDILRQEDFHRGVFHCYSGNYEQACIIMDMGFYLGFGGVLTFSPRVQDVFKRVSANRILMETDAPYLAPVPYRSKRNEPAYLVETMRVASHILGIKRDRLEKVVDDNATTLFSL